MTITLINVTDRLIAQGIILDAGSGVDALNAHLKALLPVQSWGYSFASDTLSIDVPDDTTVPDLSLFGEVSTDAAS